MITPKANSIAGSAAIVMLGIVLMLSSIAISCLDLSARNIRGWRSQVLHQRATNAADSDALKGAGTALESCNEGESTNGDITLKRQFCVLKAPLLPTNTQILIGENEGMPLINYNKIFANAERCTAATSESELLARSSVVSAYSCDLAGAIPESTTVAGNLLAAGDISLANNSQMQLAATGYISVLGRANIATDSLIIAGGDLEIQQIAANCSIPPCQITLVSATGTVRVAQSVGAIALKIWSFKQPELGFAVPEEVSTLTPDVFSALLLGFKASGE